MSGVDASRPEPDGAHEGSPGAARLTVSVTADADNAVIRADGELDATGGELLLQTARGLAPVRLRRVALDLSGVTSADLAGVRALEDVRNTIEQDGAALVIYNADIAAYPINWHSVPSADKFRRPRQP